MHLLVLSSWFPYPPDNGSRQRAFYLLRELAGRGHRIRLVAEFQGGKPPLEIPGPLTQWCESVTAVPWVRPVSRGRAVVTRLRAALSVVPRAVWEGRNAALTAAIASELSRTPDALLVLERGMDAGIPDFDATLPAVIDQIEFSADWVRRRQPTGIKSAHYWRRRLQRYRMITVVSEAEAEAARRVLGAGAPPVRVVPNGADTRNLVMRDAGGVVPGRLLYAGSPMYPPNREAVGWFVGAILPRIRAAVPEAHLAVTGVVTGFPSCSRWRASLPDAPVVQFTGNLPDLDAAYKEAAVVVVPLLRGGGTRIKILEAWAAGVPVISTSVGATGLDAVNGEHLLIADAPDTFAAAVLSLLNDTERAAQIAANARRFVETRYDWGVIGGQLDALLMEIDDRRNRP